MRGCVSCVGKNIIINIELSITGDEVLSRDLIGKLNQDAEQANIASE